MCAPLLFSLHPTSEARTKGMQRVDVVEGFVSFSQKFNHDGRGGLGEIETEIEIEIEMELKI